MDTRNQTKSEFRQATQDALARHDAQFQQLFTEMQGIQASLQILMTRVMNGHDATSGTNSGVHLDGRGPNPNNQRPYLKLQFPRFGGEDPTGWLFKADQFFEFQGVAAEDQVQLASFHLEGVALQWYRWLTRIRGPLSWLEFSQAALERFGPTDYEDPSEALTRLTQSTTVSVYQETFERLSHRVDGLPEPFLIGCFVGGLKEEIRLEVKLKNPRHLVEAIGIARLVEEKLNLHHQGYMSMQSPNPLPTDRSSLNSGLLGPAPTQHLALLAPYPVRRISNAEAKIRREKGICYYCDEKFVPGHKCSKPQFFMISDVIEVDDKPPDGETLDSLTSDHQVAMSLPALTSGKHPHTYSQFHLADKASSSWVECYGSKTWHAP